MSAPGISLYLQVNTANTEISKREGSFKVMIFLLRHAVCCMIIQEERRLFDEPSLTLCTEVKTTVIVVKDFFMSYGSFDAADAKISCRVAGARWSEHEL